LSAVAVRRTFASIYCTASQTDGDTSMAGTGDVLGDGARGLRAGTNAETHAARGDGHASRHAEKVHALLERRGFLAMLPRG
jgi:hypothetical protein